MKKLLRKVLALPLCALIATPFSAVFANVPGEPSANVQDEAELSEEDQVSDMIRTGEIFEISEAIAEHMCQECFMENPELLRTFEEKISEYRRLLGEVHLSQEHKDVLKNFFGMYWYNLNVAALSHASMASYLTQLRRNAQNNHLRENPAFVNLKRSAPELLSFVKNTTMEFRDHKCVGMYFGAKCCRIAFT